MTRNNHTSIISKWHLPCVRAWLLGDYDELCRVYAWFFQFDEFTVHSAVLWARGTVHQHGADKDLHDAYLSSLAYDEYHGEALRWRR